MWFAGAASFAAKCAATGVARERHPTAVVRCTAVGRPGDLAACAARSRARLGLFTAVPCGRGGKGAPLPLAAVVAGCRRPLWRRAGGCDGSAAGCSRVVLALAGVAVGQPGAEGGARDGLALDEDRDEQEGGVQPEEVEGEPAGQAVPAREAARRAQRMPSRGGGGGSGAGVGGGVAVECACSRAPGRRSGGAHLLSGKTAHEERSAMKRKM